VRLKQAHLVHLDHRAYFLRAGPLPFPLLAAGQEGRFSLVGPDYRVTEVARWPGKIRDVSLGQAGRLLAVIDTATGRLSVVRYDGSVVSVREPPPVLAGAPAWVKPGFTACSFGGEGGDVLWSAAAPSEEEVVVQAHAAAGGGVAGAAVVEDLFGGSHCSLFPTGRPEVMAFWLNAGQNGQQVYWISKGARALTCEPEPRLRDTTPPAFSPGGDEFLAADDERGVCRYTFPAVRRIGRCRWGGAEGEDFGDYLCYLDGSHALVGSHAGRVFLLDVGAMEVTDEVEVQGHGPKRAEEYYPTLAGDSQLCTDLAQFERLGETVVFSHRRDGGYGLGGWKDTLSCFRLDDVLGLCRG
jgi:hypothetical protein